MTITLRIIGFHNCHGCSEKVKEKLSNIGVKLVELNSENGNVTIATAKPPEEVRQYLKKKLKKSVIVLSRDLVPGENQSPNHVVSHQWVPTNGAFDLQNQLGQAAIRLAPVLKGVEITNTNTMRINFIHRENYPPVFRPEHGGYIGIRIRDVECTSPQPSPWAAKEPSAPLMPTEEQVVYGYPPACNGVHTTRTHDDPINGCCNIM